MAAVLDAPPADPPTDDEPPVQAVPAGLPWPRVFALVAALAFLAACIGYVVGQGRPPGEGTADVGFLHDMGAHHAQALYLADLELLNGSEPAIQLFAREILRNQSFEQGQMHDQLRAWGYAPEDPPAVAMTWAGTPHAPDEMPGLATPEELDALADAEGADADALFVRLMQDHHQGGVEMADAAAERVDDAEVTALAERMARNQRLEIGEMEAARIRYGLPADPAGWTPELFIDHSTSGESGATGSDDSGSSGGGTDDGSNDEGHAGH